MQYNPPLGSPDPDAPFINGNPALGVEGSVHPAAASEYPQREIIAVIEAAGLVPTNSDLSQLLAAIQTLKGGRAVFTTNGTFSVPAGVTTIYISGCGGGGGGGSAIGYNPTRIFSASGGGAGRSVIKQAFTVTPRPNY